MQARPSFSALLASSLKADARMRAWYDASLGYQQVQQTRLPKALPKVMSHLMPQVIQALCPRQCSHGQKLDSVTHKDNAEHLA